jgi:hypothetical protein
MITPTQIKTRAESLYRRYVKSWLLGDANEFPLRVVGTIKLNRTDIAGNQRGIELLRAKSRVKIGWGYRLEEKHVASPTMGHGMRPTAVWIDSPDDLIRLAGRETEFAQIVRCVERLRDELPGLERWWMDHWGVLPKLHGDIEQLIAVTKYFIENPRPNCFAQQLPIEIHTKFIKGHQGVLKSWLNLLLPPSAVISHAKSFAKRFGLRESQVQRRVLLLDPDLLRELGLPFNDFAVPVGSLKELSVTDMMVVIVENRASLESVPRLPRTMAFWGEGLSIGELETIGWLRLNRVLYWGDIDPAGFRILSILRGVVPNVESILMDQATYFHHERFATAVEHPAAALAHLTDLEEGMYQYCEHHKLQLEQEKLTQKWVSDAFTTTIRNAVWEISPRISETSQLPAR